MAQPLPVEQFPAPPALLAIADAARDAGHVLSRYWIIEVLPPDLNPAQLWGRPGGTDYHSMARFYVGTVNRILAALNDLDAKLAGLTPDYLDGLGTDLPKGLDHPTGGTAVRGWPYSVHRAIDELKSFRGKFQGDEPVALEDIQGLVTAEDVLRKAATPNEQKDQSATGVQRQAKPDGLTTAEMNVIAGKYLKKYAKDGHVVTVTELIREIKPKNPSGTCSRSTACNLPVYRAYRDELERLGLAGGKTQPSAVSYSDDVEAVAGECDEELGRLIQQHWDDFEPSPLVDAMLPPFGSVREHGTKIRKKV